MSNLNTILTDLYNTLQSNVNFQPLSTYHLVSRTTSSRKLTFGYGNTGPNRGVGNFIANKKHPEVYDKLIKLANAICPKDFKYNQIYLTKNIQCNLHTDTAQDKSIEDNTVFISFGEFYKDTHDSGNTRIHQSYDDLDIFYDVEQNIPVLFNGAKYPHQTLPYQVDDEIDGNRYSIVIFKNKYHTIPKEMKPQGKFKCYKVEF